MAFATSKTTACVCAFCAAEMAGESFRNLSEKLPAEGACPRLWCRACRSDGNIVPRCAVPDGLLRLVGMLSASTANCGGQLTKKGLLFFSNPLKSGGEGEIRTPERLATLRAFQARALGHYATSPFVREIQNSSSLFLRSLPLSLFLTGFFW